MQTVRVLLVDDDEDDFTLTKDILCENSDNHYELTWCNNYSEAVNAMVKSHYDVYLVDYRLGKESGIDLLNEAIKSNCPEPIIMLTGKGDPTIDREALRRGAADYLVKDKLSWESLDRSIRYAMAQSNALQQIKKSENKFRVLFERSKEPMIITSPQGNILEANQAATKFFESSVTDLLKTNGYTLFRNDQDEHRYRKTMNAEGCVTDFELEILTPTGKIKHCSISSFLEVSQHANEERYYSIIHDLAFRLIREKDRAISERLEATARIAKNLSDEIQNPLSNINLAIDELCGILDENNLVLADIIKENCERINHLTSELIESTEAVSLHLSETDLNGLIQELLDEAQHEFECKVSFTPANSKLTLKAEAGNLKSALKNILQNASEAIEKETGMVELLLEKHPNTLKIDIIDNGHGIPEEHVDKIFEPFYTTKAKSMGMGLARAQRIVNAHNGHIHISSNTGKGTTITVLIPV